MKYKQNLHTHTIYDDGKHTPREMVEWARRLGFDSIGFSGHSDMQGAVDWCMTAEGTKEYFEEVNRLKKEFFGELKIFCGVEYDIYSGTPVPECDYTIGSVHGFMIDGKFEEFDCSRLSEVEDFIKRYFGGDGMKYAKSYFEALGTLPEYGSFDIIGHFDIITKYCKKREFFDMNSKKYLSYAMEAAAALKGRIPFFEVNTGAVARGYRTTPYPSVPILKGLCEMGFGAVITSDCHDGTKLDCCYDDAQELLRSCGFDRNYVLTDRGFEPVKL